MIKRPFPKSKDKPLTWALYYLSLGWCVIPIMKGEKKPKVKWKAYQEKLPTEKQVKKWWQSWPKANIAVLTGKVSGGLYILDVDSKQGKADLEKLSGDNPIPWTPTVKTARGEHLYFKSKETHKTYNGQGWDLKGEKSYALAPPSVHKTGKAYGWGKLQTPEYKLAPLPTWLQDALKNQKKPDRTFEIDQNLQDLLRPYWEKEGQRHLLALGLAGYLYSLSWPLAMVRHLFEKICSLVNDNELQERLDTLNDTYEKGEQGEQVTGYDTLRGIFVGTELDRLEELARGRHIPLKMRQIDNIRKSKNPKWLTDRQIGEKVKGYFRERGRFLKVEGNRCYYFDTLTKQVLSLFCPEMETVLDLEFGINPADQLTNAIQKTLRSETLRYGKDVKVYRFGHFDPDKHLIYIYAGNGVMYRLDGKRKEAVDNGTDKVYFEETIKNSWWKADFKNPLNPYQVLVEDLSFDTGKGVALEAELQKKVFWLWLRTLFFEEIQPTKPILVLTGDRGSGKSTALRRVLKLLFGEEANVVDLKDKESWTPALTSNYLLGLDNIDRRVKWLPGKLDVAATGQRISVRRLYVTNVEESYKVRCFIAMTSLDPPFSEGTTASRMLILRMKPLKKLVPENVLSHNVLKQRNQFWAGLLNQLNKDLELEKGKYIQTAFRMADFAALAVKLSRGEPDGLKTFEQIIKGLEEEQKAQILSKSVVPGYIEKDSFNPEHGYTVAELFAKWKVLADDENLGFSFRSVEILGRELVNIRGDLLNEYGVAWRRDHSKQVYFFPKTVQRASLEMNAGTDRKEKEKEKGHKDLLKRHFEREERIND